ncbi:putative naringenin-chalcone synthase [Opitutaceae bacterium TAV1]|nr:putative naringenin-chalcone synthase [Opitutaceae bacterium TAV1]
MHLHALATALPSDSFTQRECWDIVRASDRYHRLQRRSQLILRSVLTGDSGIATRHFAMPEIERIFERTPDELNAIFRDAAPRLAGVALKRALEQAGLHADALDALLVCTCTGYLCPGVSSYVAEQAGLRSDVFLQDLAGLGCAAAIPTLRAAQGVLAARPGAVVACIAVEVCSAAFYLDDDPGVLLSSCLFADGAAATLWRDTAGPSGLRCGGFSSLHEPQHRDRIRFEMRDGKLRNLLHASVPELAASAVSRLFAAEAAQSGDRPIIRIIAHAGGRDVIQAIEAAVPGYPLDATRAVLRRCGNMSSPSVLFALEEALAGGKPGPAEDWWLVSFGAGFSAHGCRLGVSAPT